ncbi:unnamed protein product [Merluccius merluccius]
MDSCSRPPRVAGSPGPSVGPPNRRPRPALSGLGAARVKLKVECPKCDLKLYAKNLKTHLERRHSAARQRRCYFCKPSCQPVC